MQESGETPPSSQIARELVHRPGRPMFQVVGIGFNDLRQLLRRLGFEERIRGSHHLVRKPGVEEKINPQRDGSKAKPYQVRPVRATILRHKIGEPA